MVIKTHLMGDRKEGYPGYTIEQLQLCFAAQSGRLAGPPDEKPALLDQSPLLFPPLVI